MRRNPRRRRSRSGSESGGAEQFEQRLLLTAVPWIDAPNLTLSFAPDGTDVAGRPNELYEVLDSLGPRDEWTSAITRGFETWTSLVDANLTIIPDGGQKFGTAGVTYADPRFGDVRIAAIPLEESVFAMSVPHDQFVVGTWAGDIIINSNANWTSIDDVFRVVLHEAGHVMGLEHSDDPNSPMFTHGIPDSITPTQEDTDLLLELYGIERGDDEERIQHESDDDDQDNDVFDSATLLNPTAGYPKLRYTLTGNIASEDDVDIYRFRGYEDTETEAEVTTIALRSTQRGRLLPKITLHDDEGRRIHPDDLEILQHGNGSIVIQTDEVDPEEDYFIRIRSAVNEDEVSSGDYHLTVSSRVEPTEPRDAIEGELTDEFNEEFHTLYLSRPQLISMAIEVDREPEAHRNTAVGLALFDANGDLITTTSANDGETRSLETQLLPAGTYYISVRAESEDELPELFYNVFWFEVNRDSGPLPTDPTGDAAFPCKDGSGNHCFPDGHVSPNPTHTNPGTGNSPPNFDRYAILLSWLSWWADDNTGSGWVDPNNDQFSVPQGTSTSLDVTENDTAVAPLEVRSVQQPAQGAASLNLNGTIQFEAPASFSGSTTFEYEIGAQQAAVAPQLAAGDSFGSSVALFGPLAVVGAPFSDIERTDAGAAYVYRRVGAEWVLEQTLVASDAQAGDRFGTRVAVDGTTIVVSAPREDELGKNSGAAYVFEFDPDTEEFFEELKLQDPKGREKDLFGSSVAVYGDTIVVGAMADDGRGTNSGSAFVFDRDVGGPDNWGLTQKLKASDASTTAQFGWSIDVEENRMVIGARRDDVAGVNAGAAYVFERTGGSGDDWNEVTRLVPSGVRDRDGFGGDVGISGSTVVVGSPLEDDNGKNSGAAYVFQQNAGGNNNWGQTQVFQGQRAGDKTGFSVSIDQSVMVVASPAADPNAVLNAGSATVYAFDSAASQWNEDYRVTPDVAKQGDLVGWSTDVFRGTTLLGAPRSDADGSKSGHLVVEDTRRATAQVTVDVGSPLQAESIGSSEFIKYATSEELHAATDRAIELWGVEPRTYSVQFADLDGSLLGLTIGSRILIDRDAAGHGWFSGDTGHGMSLDTVVAHEFGHVLGLRDTYEDADVGSLMFGRLDAGQVRMNNVSLDQLFKSRDAELFEPRDLRAI